MLISAHGISNTERTALQQAGKRLVDTTCPLVRRAHDAALKLQRNGYHVLVIGRADHVEVRGLVGDLIHFDIIESAADVRTFPHARLGIICQTTTLSSHVRDVRAAIAAANPQAEIRFIDTVCQPTKDRQVRKLWSDCCCRLMPWWSLVEHIPTTRGNSCKRAGPGACRCCMCSAPPSCARNGSLESNAWA